MFLTGFLTFHVQVYFKDMISRGDVLDVPDSHVPIPTDRLTDRPTYQQTSHFNKKDIKHSANFTEPSSSWKAASRQAVQEFPAFNGSRMFIAVFTRAIHSSIS
jgi:hypothetical protein